MSKASDTQKPSQSTDKVLFEGAVKDGLYALQTVTERNIDRHKRNILDAEIDVHFGCWMWKTLPPAPTVEIEIVSPSGKILFSKSDLVSGGWNKVFTSAHVVFHPVIPEPPANSAVRVYFILEGNRHLLDAAMYLDNPLWTPAASRFLNPALAKSVVYEKICKRGSKWTYDLTNTKVIQQQKKEKTPAEALAQLSNPNAVEKPTYEPAPPDVLQALQSYYLVPVYEWQHCYSHVGLGDRVGEIVLPNQSRMKWMIRPGGLAAVVDPNGGIVYLAGELQTLKVTN